MRWWQSLGLMYVLYTALSDAEPIASHAASSHDTDALLFSSQKQIELSVDGPVGWQAIDRFVGFRYEFPVKSTKKEQIMQEIRQVAMGNHCFGWIQTSKHETTVGEARCPKSNVNQLLTTLHAHADKESRKIHIKTYANTKIRYHFTDFRILREAKFDKTTCFLEPPHACIHKDTSGSSDPGYIDTSGASSGVSLPYPDEL